MKAKSRDTGRGGAGETLRLGVQADFRFVADFMSLSDTLRRIETGELDADRCEVGLSSTKCCLAACVSIGEGEGDPTDDAQVELEF